MSVSSEELKFDREKWAELLKPIISMWKSLKKQIYENGVEKITEKMLQDPDPINAFVFAEAHTSTQIIETIDNSIEGISQVHNRNRLFESP